MKSAASVGTEVTSRSEDRRRRRQDDRGNAKQADDRLPEGEHGEAEQQRRGEFGGARVHDVKAMRWRTMRPMIPISATSTAESAAAVNSAAQICTVWP